MDLATLKESLTGETPPASLTLALQALWWDAKGGWHQAHDVLQNDESREGAWVHAYLHRKEGDAANARYWYGRASQPTANGSLEDEWAEIVKALLG